MSSTKRKTVIQKIFSSFEQRSTKGPRKTTDTNSPDAIENYTSIAKQNDFGEKISNLSDTLSKLKRDIAELMVTEIELIDVFLEHHEKLRHTNLYIGDNNKHLRPMSFAANELFRSYSGCSSKSFRIKSCYEPDFDIFRFSSSSESIERNTEKEKLFVRENFICASLKSFVEKENISNTFDYQLSCDDADSGTWDEVENIASVNVAQIDSESENLPETLGDKNKVVSEDQIKNQGHYESRTFHTDLETPTGVTPVTESNIKTLPVKNSDLNDDRPDSFLFFGSQAFNIDEIISSKKGFSIDSNIQAKNKTSKENYGFKNVSKEELGRKNISTNDVRRNKETEHNNLTKEENNRKNDIKEMKECKNIRKKLPAVNVECPTNVMQDSGDHCSASNTQKYYGDNSTRRKVQEIYEKPIKESSSYSSNGPIRDSYLKNDKALRTNEISTSKKTVKRKQENILHRQLDIVKHPATSREKCNEGKENLHNSDETKENYETKTMMKYSQTKNQPQNPLVKNEMSSDKSSLTKTSRYDLRKNNSAKLKDKNIEISRRTKSCKKGEERLSLKERMENYLRAVERL